MPIDAKIEALLERGKTLDAEKLLEEDLQGRADDPQLNSMLARCCLDLKHIRKGIGAVNRALVFDVGKPELEILLDQFEDMRQGKRKHLHFPQVDPPEKWPGVSLCMIVRNEEKNLEECLASVGDLACEKIVVDTGSTDRTVEIARSLGAKVFLFPWNDNFSDARNESIKHAQGDWILILDGDERIKPLDLARLKWAAACGKADIYSCLTENVGKSHGEEDHYDVIRLFRNHAGLCYESPLHHTIMPSAVRLGLSAARTNIAIQHYGYALDEKGWEAKNRRNLAALDKGIASNQGDIFSRIVHAAIQYSLGKRDEAYREWEGALPGLEDNHIPSAYLGLAYALLIQHYRQTNTLEALPLLMENALVDFPRSQSLWTLAGETYIQSLNQARVGTGILERASRLKIGDSYSAVIGELWGFQEGDWALALMKQYVLHGEIQKAVRVCLMGKKYALAKRVAQEALKIRTARGEPVEKLKQLAKAETGQGEWSEARDTLELAIALEGVEKGAWHELAAYSFQAGDPESSRQYCTMALFEDEMDAGMLVLNGILAVNTGRFAAALEWFVRGALADQQNEMARANLAEAARTLDLPLFEVIHRQGLTWMERGENKLARTAFERVLQENPGDVEARKMLAGLVG